MIPVRCRIAPWPLRRPRPSAGQRGQLSESSKSGGSRHEVMMVLWKQLTRSGNYVCSDGAKLGEQLILGLMREILYDQVT